MLEAAVGSMVDIVFVEQVLHGEGQVEVRRDGPLRVNIMYRIAGLIHGAGGGTDVLDALDQSTVPAKFQAVAELIGDVRSPGVADGGAQCAMIVSVQLQIRSEEHTSELQS